MRTSWIVATTLLISGCSGGGSGGASRNGAGAEPAREVPAVRALASAQAVVPVSGGAVDKIDLLLMIDNSRSMSDKQQILSAVLPGLMSRLVNPLCVDDQGNLYPAPAEGSSTCAAGQHQEFQPIGDIHVGIISSSLGDAGSNVACPADASYAKYNPDQVDMGHLLGSLPRNTAQTNAQGFLEWHAGSTDAADFNRNFQELVKDVGESGCGWEAQLESWYRFLVDPVPYRGLARVQCRGSSSAVANCVQRLTGEDGRFLLDETLLDQRDAFLRPDSLVAIVMLSDENDCSAQVGDQSWVIFNIEDTRPMFKGSAICAENPNDKCCYSCAMGAPKGCAPDPTCNEARLSPELDGQNLRCFDQKRRFGVDLLYPTQRYVNALTQAELCWSALDLSLEGCDEQDIFPNPLFVSGRSPFQVLLAGIIGVPTQALEAGSNAGAAPGSLANAVRFKSYEELTNGGIWDQILGSPGVAWQERKGSQPEILGSAPVPPNLPQMVESPSPRTGVRAGNTLNGREYDATQGTAKPGGTPRADDLQYACISPLPVPRDCAALNPEQDACDCFDGVNQRPLCEQTPGTSAPGTTQFWAKAYPSLRELQVLKDYGERTSNSIVASICALEVTDTSSPNYGYRPAMDALISRMAERLPPAVAP